MESKYDFSRIMMWMFLYVVTYFGGLFLIALLFMQRMPKPDEFALLSLLFPAGLFTLLGIFPVRDNGQSAVLALTIYHGFYFILACIGSARRNSIVYIIFIFIFILSIAANFFTGVYSKKTF